MLPIKASLLVAPAALLPQWEAEVAKHTQKGALKVCTYVGLGGASQPAPPPPPPPHAHAGGLGEDAEGAETGRRSKRARGSVRRYEPSAGSGRAAMRAAQEARATEVEESVAPVAPLAVLAATREGLFQDRKGAPVAVAECDLIFCSFETLREELKHQLRHHATMGSGHSIPRAGGGAAAGDGGVAATTSPLLMLGFWRIILDEAQIVSNSNSAAALMASALWRRHAWLVTGTPVNAKLSELQGLLAFLDVRPFADPQAFNALVHTAYERRASPAALLRMRTLLSAHMLRRTKSDPVVAEQLQLPPLEWITISLPLAEAERAAYDAATSDLRASYATCFHSLQPLRPSPLIEC